MMENTAKSKAATKGQHDVFVRAGGIIPTEKDCIGSHHPESPTYKKFVFFGSLERSPIQRRPGKGDVKNRGAGTTRIAFSPMKRSPFTTDG